MDAGNPTRGSAAVTSLLVLTSVVVLPFMSLLFDLVLLEAARTRSRLMAIAQQSHTTRPDHR